MPTGPTEVDPTVLRALLRRLSELETEAHAVTDAVLGHLPYAGPGIADATVREVGADLVDAFSRLADSVAITGRSLATAQQRYVEADHAVGRAVGPAVGRAVGDGVDRIIDLTQPRAVDLTLVRDLDSATR
jgi:hypothetical protein